MKPNPKFSAKAGYHQFWNRDARESYGSFEVCWFDQNDRDFADSESIGDGWFWAACFPGCLPDSDWSGPFTSSSAAYADAREA